MSALYDATGGTSTTDATHIGFASNVIPEAKGSPTGVSVEYIPDPAKQWFVLRVSYGRSDKAQDILNINGLSHYLPVYRTKKIVKGKRRMCTVPFFPSLIFAYAEPERIDTLMKDKLNNPVLSYYYNHFAVDRTGKNPPLTVPHPVMHNFIRLTSIDDEHIRVVDPRTCRYKRGDTVIVTEGKFKGIVGKLARVAQEQRVVINIEGVGMIASAYIPSAFVEVYGK